MTEDLAAALGNRGDEHGVITPQSVDEIHFLRPAKCRANHAPDRGLIGNSLGTNM